MNRSGSWIATSLVSVLLSVSTPAQVTQRVSVDTAGLQANALCEAPSISADGRHVAFAGLANNLVSGDTNGTWDIFVRDRLSGTTDRVSVDSVGTQGNGWSREPSISADGRYVAFTSDATNLVPGDTNGYYDVFIRDRQSGTTSRISLDSAGAQGNWYSWNPSISCDGRWVAFQSKATNLIGVDTNASEDIYIHDRLTGSTTRVSVSSTGMQGNSDSGFPVLSSDGRYVAFYSFADNLVSGDTNGTHDVFVHDRQSGMTERVSLNSAGVQGNGYSYVPSLSADGRYIAFNSESTNLVDADQNGRSDVFVRDRQTGVTTRVSVTSSGAEANGGSSGRSMLSSDGRYVIFYSDASNLVVNDTNNTTDVFLRDRQAELTTRVSVDSSGAQANGESGWSTISRYGRYVAFASHAANLVPGDTNGSADVFVRDRAGSPLAPEYHVFLGSTSIPLQNVTVTAELGPPSNPTVVSTATTGGDGSYSFTSPVPPAGIYRVRARIAYTDPGTGAAITVYAYPGDDPYGRWCLGCTPHGGSDGPGELPAMVFPWPVVMQAGWDGGVLQWFFGQSGGTYAWYDSGPPANPDKAIPFLTEDPGDWLAPHFQRKKDDRIPAFLCFPVPKSAQDQTFGYDSDFDSDYDDNADLLANWIEQKVKPVLSPVYVSPQLFGSVKFSFVCHSMGGPIVRALVTRDSPNAHPPVHKIVSMDGIHGGGFFTYVPLPLGHLSERYMNGTDSAPSPCVPQHPGWNRPVNTDITHRDRWLLFADRGRTTLGDFVGPDLSAWGHGRVVLSTSTYVAQLDPPYCVADWVDGTHRWANNGHVGIHDSIDRLSETARFLLGRSQGLEDQEPLIAAQREPAPGLGFVAGSLAVPAGATVSTVVPFDTNRNVWGEFLRGGQGTSFVLRDAGGTVIPLAALQTGEIVLGTFVDRFELTMPAAGPTTIECTAGATPGAMQYAFAFENGNRLEVEASPATATTGQSVQVQASMRNLNGTLLVGSNGIFDASVGLPQSYGSVPMTLYDDGAHADGGAGDGIFGNVFPPSVISGQHLVTCRGTITVGSEVISRSGSVRFDVAPSGISLVGGPVVTTPDADGDGLCDSLVLTQTVALATPRSVSLAARLLDAGGQVVHSPTGQLLNPVSAGTYTVALVVPGTEIVRHGVDGPWTLADLTVHDVDADNLPAAAGPAFATPALPASSFAHPGLPQVHRVVPSSGARAGGTLVVLYGTGMQDTTSVTVGSQSATFVVTGDSTIEVTIPPISSASETPVHALGAVPVDVTVTSAWGHIIADNGFTYIALQPH